jgi:hypothetical protein
MSPSAVFTFTSATSRPSAGVVIVWAETGETAAQNPALSVVLRIVRRVGGSKTGLRDSRWSESKMAGSVDRPAR